MARIIAPAPVAPSAPRWAEAGEEVVTIALDKNEAVAVRNALRDYRNTIGARPDLSSTSLIASGARVHDALAPFIKANGWH